MYAEATDKNLVTSPIGVLLLVSLYATGTTGTNREDIIAALGETSYMEMYNSFKGLSKKYSAMNTTYFTLANKLYVAKSFEISSQFAKDASLFCSEIDLIDFTEPEAATATINDWANVKTKGQIQNPVEEGTIEADSATALFNIIFFKGSWKKPFSARDTMESDFHVTKTNVVKKTTMVLKHCMLIADSAELGAKILELPYKEAGFRMFIFLPHSIDGLPSLLEKTAKKGLLKGAFDVHRTNSNVRLLLPKFDIKVSKDLNRTLQKIGLARIFSEGAPGIVKNHPVVVSKVFQEAFIKVDEEGSTAGVVTGVVNIPLMGEPEEVIDFIADHPFLYAILHDDIILFIGTLAE